MDQFPLWIVIGLAILGSGVLIAAVSVRASGQCRHRVAHARVIAQARRIEDSRRRQIMERLSVSDPPMLPGLRSGSNDRR
jgi:hypothetical protein